MTRFVLLGWFLLGSSPGAPAQPSGQARAVHTPARPTAPPNVIFILIDDLRFDALGFTGRFPGYQTPNLDRMRREGVWCRNSFVSTSLCSPSRASILTGQYAHSHTVVDNQAPLPANFRSFPRQLQQAGYQTAFLGKWHMGNEDDAPQPGFNHWVSFRGQGVYYNPTLNVNGKRVAHGDSTYITDLLTDLSIDWLKGRTARATAGQRPNARQPFFLYLSHKAAHHEFMPARRHRGRYRDLRPLYPASMFLTATDTSRFQPTGTKTTFPVGTKVNLADMPNWVKAQRHSWHGVDYMYHGGNFDQFYRDYLETMLAVDESVGRLLDYLRESGLDKNTVVMFMGDNGLTFGERGLIDKRHAYEESMRVPLLVWAPGRFAANGEVPQLLQNIDIAPTILDLAGLKPRPDRSAGAVRGRSFAPLLRGQSVPWRDTIFYEYYWESQFPQTPTLFAVRTDRYKYIFNQGVWDINELYDLQTDPDEVNNLIRQPEHMPLARQLQQRLWDWLETTQGDRIPLKRINSPKFDHKYKGTW